ncbi:hypothetical protein C7Y66_07970 [Chroococcidiopsis sp. CCALA 051]|uniref:DUF192 domain-containing protein n=1 Tax=Chroococcidiopsis sp. CCALA 051 TaxID=869949 RepID=UPI000D0D7A71|nr:DUF192 domain-containing protein [Chroococcidiopsidales cyanobacterium LEGE 13417]PSM49702.1 hypothetical protein C7Y66_07970 [Chroococcidiopsis sp. CCALA 051]
MNQWLGIVISFLLLGCTPIIATEPMHVVQAPAKEVRGQNLPISAYATIAGRRFELEVAKTPQQQQTGLMYRTSLADNRGMLFVFESPQPTRFWMKNTLIPLDMIFLREGRVIEIAADVPPCKTTTCPTYGTDTEIDKVLELRSGMTAQIGLKVGDRVEIQYLN